MRASKEPCSKDDDMFEDSDSDGISTKPFAELTVYGSKLWKRPIAFVPAAPGNPVAAPAVQKPSFADMYRAIVFPNGLPQPAPSTRPICGVCNAPIIEPNDRDHYLSPVHQGALPQIHTPSGIDRTRFGLKVLEKHGFDIDERKGLGADGQGRLFPIIPKEKRDKFGLGVDKQRVEEERKKALPPKKATLDAGKIRKLAEQQKKKDKVLQRMFYGNDDVERYLGGGARVDHGLK